MISLNSVNLTIEQKIIANIQGAKKTVANPDIIKKILDLLSKVIEGANYASGKVYYPDLARSMKGGVEIINFFNLFKTAVYWINPLDEKNIDKAHLQKTLDQTLQNYLGFLSEKDYQNLSNQLMKEVLQDSIYLNQKQMLRAFEKSLIAHGYKSNAQVIVRNLVIIQKSRPKLEVLSKVCFTVSNSLSTILVLKKWGVLDVGELLQLGKIAAELGKHSKVFFFIAQVGLKPIIGVVGCVGDSIVFVNSIHNLIKAQSAMTHAHTQEMQTKARLARTQAIWDIATAGLNLTSSALPLLLAVNPPIVIGLSIIAKGTGLVAVFLKP
jgi:hypothetical protein